MSEGVRYNYKTMDAVILGESQEWFDAKTVFPDNELPKEVKCADGFQTVAWMNEYYEWNMDLPFDCDYYLKNVIFWKNLTPPPD